MQVMAFDCFSLLVFLNVYFMIRFAIIIAFGIEKWIHNNIFSFQTSLLLFNSAGMKPYKIYNKSYYAIDIKKLSILLAVLWIKTDFSHYVINIICLY
jgi:hypothetical protein